MFVGTFPRLPAYSREKIPVCLQLTGIGWNNRTEEMIHRNPAGMEKLIFTYGHEIGKPIFCGSGLDFYHMTPK